MVWFSVAAYMGIGTTYLDILIKRRSLPASKLGGRVIVRRQDIDEYLRLCSPVSHSLSEYDRKARGSHRTHTPVNPMGFNAQESLPRFHKD